jgi:hypothetical protein
MIPATADISSSQIIDSQIIDNLLISFGEVSIPV